MANWQLTLKQGLCPNFGKHKRKKRNENKKEIATGTENMHRILHNLLLLYCSARPGVNACEMGVKNPVHFFGAYGTTQTKG